MTWAQTLLFEAGNRATPGGYAALGECKDGKRLYIEGNARMLAFALWARVQTLEARVKTLESTHLDDPDLEYPR